MKVLLKMETSTKEIVLAQVEDNKFCLISYAPGQLSVTHEFQDYEESRAAVADLAVENL